LLDNVGKAGQLAKQASNVTNASIYSG